MAVAVSEAGLWGAARAGRNEAARTALVERYLYLADLTVTRTVPRVPIRLDREDLVAEAQLALVRAVDRFDAARGTAFPSFAITVMRGAVREYLRREDWVPRSVRRRERAGEGVAPLSLVSLESVIEDGGDMPDRARLEQIADPSPGPEAIALAAAARDLLTAAVASLPEREQFAVRAYHGDGRLHREIAADLGRSAGRAQQLIQQGLAGLRAYFDQHPEEKQLVDHLTEAGLTLAVKEATLGSGGGAMDINHRVRMPEDLREALRERAWENRRSFNAEIVAALWAYVGEPERVAEGDSRFRGPGPRRAKVATG